MPKAMTSGKSSKSGQFVSGSKTLNTRKGQAEAMVQAAKKGRAERVGAALKQASSSTGILRKG